MSIAETKRRLRAAMRDRLLRISEQERTAAGRAVARQILGLLRSEEGRPVALYAALEEELPTRELMLVLLEQGHPVLLPRAGRGERLEFARVTDPADLVLGPWGILEPPRSQAAVELGSDMLVLVPGLAFDRAGGRLGRGAGWYDRSLSSEIEDVFGVAFACQVVDRVPTTPGDRNVRGIFTEDGLVDATSRDTSRVVPARPS